MEIGRYDIRSVETGRFRLDGGAMFGVVPRALWAKVAPPDDLNRIQLSMRTLVVRDLRAGRVILVDTGAGNKWTATERERFAFDVAEDRIAATLAQIGLSPDDVTDILVTHLHFDHNGGLTRWADETADLAVPCFPRARVWVHRRHWEHGNRPTHKDRASFLEHDFAPIERAGLLRLIDGDPPECPFDGLKLHCVNGHTPAQILPWFAAEGRELLYTGDLFPTFAHLPVPWVMAYDLEPLKTIVEKKHVLKCCWTRDLALASVHDPTTACAKIVEEKGRPALGEIVPL